MRILKRIWPLLLIAALLAGAYALGLHRQLSWSALATHETELRAAVAANPAGMAAAYVAVYVAVVAVSIPGGIWLTMGGGLLFGALPGTALAVVAATAGAVLVFLVARSALAPLLRARAGPFLDRVRPGLQRDGFSYLLALRLIPVVPFWLSNLAPALVGMRLPPYAAATFLGIIPATAVFASVGAGLGDVLAAGGQPDPGRLLLSPGVLLPLLGLALLSLLPVGWRRWRMRNA
jgi:uncharacterized membrane protein YdjX (TVP38/TMEM64 family)